MKFFFHYRFTLIYYYLTLPLIFSYSFRCEEGQKMKKDNLKFSINETSFPDELLLERNNNILYSLRIKILNTKTKTQFNRWTFQCNVILFNYNILTELQKILITLCFFWACTSSPKPQIASETVCITARLISSSSNAFFFLPREKIWRHNIFNIICFSFSFDIKKVFSFVILWNGYYYFFSLS